MKMIFGHSSVDLTTGLPELHKQRVEIIAQKIIACGEGDLPLCMWCGVCKQRLRKILDLRLKWMGFRSLHESLLYKSAGK
jgi:hypothetical protein